MNRSDKELVTQAKKGDQAALEQLYLANFDSLYRFVRFKVDNDMRAEDVVAEGFTKAFEKIGSFKGNSSFKSWLYTITKNIIIDWYRSKDMQTELQEDIVSGDAGFDEEVQQEKESQDLQVEKKLESILQQLQPNYRMVLELRFLSRLSIKETAKVMKVSENNAKVIQNRAIKQAQALVGNLSINYT